MSEDNFIQGYLTRGNEVIKRYRDGLPEEDDKEQLGKTNLADG